MPPVFAFIADTDSGNGKALLELLPELGTGATCIAGNSLAEFQASPLLPEVDVVVVVVFAGGKPSVLADLWPLCPKVRWVHSMAAGVDTLVPVLNALPRGPSVPLTNAKGAFSRSLAEYSLAAMLHFNKQIPRLQRNRLDKNWDKFTMGELHGQTVGFVGYGDIAQTTARLCKAFGMRVVAVRHSRKRAAGDVEPDAIHYLGEATDGAVDGKLEVFRESDYVVCSLPGGPKTYHFCGAAEFAAMRPSGVFISLGRGSCVDEAALVDALRAGKIAGAALDVFEKEPLPADSPLWGCENLLLSPHNADLTAGYMRATWDLFLKKVATYTSPGFEGFDDTVDKEKGY